MSSLLSLTLSDFLIKYVQNRSRIAANKLNWLYKTNGWNKGSCFSKFQILILLQDQDKSVSKITSTWESKNAGYLDDSSWMERAKSLSESHHYEPEELLQNDSVDMKRDGSNNYDSSSSSSSRFLILKYFIFQYIFSVNRIKMKSKQVILQFWFFAAKKGWIWLFSESVYQEDRVSSPGSYQQAESLHAAESPFPNVDESSTTSVNQLKSFFESCFTDWSSYPFHTLKFFQVSFFL